MRKLLFTITIVLATVASQASAQYCTPGSSKKFTFETLSKIENSGVVTSGNKSYVVNSDIEIASTDTLEICDGERIFMADRVTVEVNGYAKFTPTLLATVLPTTTDATPYGFKFTDSDASGEIRNVVFNGVGIKYVGKVGLTIENCSFYKSNSAFGQGAVIFSVTGSKNVVRGCRFVETQQSAVLTQALFSSPSANVVVEDCYFENCVTKNINSPFLNLAVSGSDTVVVRNNTLVGAKLTKCGGIGVANMMSVPGPHYVLIEGNDVRNCRYGITTTGMMNARIINNNLVDNKWETNANNGGSGLNYYTVSGAPQVVYAEGNYMKGNLWGVTSVGPVEANMGKVVDVKADDYNPGRNVFSDNGNNGVLYDLYNNSTNTLYAQGNTWGVAEQTAAEIEKVIFHKNDDANLGEVIFMPAGPQSGVDKVDAALTESKNLSFDGERIVSSAACEFTVYDMQGEVVAVSGKDAISFNISNLPSGAYIVKATLVDKVEILKVLK